MDSELSADAVLLEYLRGRSKEARMRFAMELLQPRAQEGAPEEAAALGEEDMGELEALMGAEEESAENVMGE